MRVVQLASSAVFGILIARDLGTETFGAYNLARAITQLLFLLAAFGLDKILVRELAREPARAMESLAVARLLRTATSVALIPIALLSARAISSGSDSLVALTLVFSTSAVLRAANVYTAWNESQLYQRDTALSLIVAALVAALMRAACLLLDANALWFAGCVVAETAVALLSMRWFYAERQEPLSHAQPIGRSRLIRGFLGEGWPLIINALLVYVYLRSDTVMLALYKGNSAAGVYSAALQISETFNLIPVAIISVLAPSLYRLSDSSPKDFDQRIRLLLETANIGCAAVAVITGLLSDTVISALFGPEYALSSDVLVIHIWAAIFGTHGVLRSVWLVAQGRQKYGLYTIVLGALLNLVLNFLWIPKHGVVGAAFATVIANGTAAFLGNVVSSKLRGYLRLQVLSILPISTSRAVWRAIRRRAPRTPGPRS